MIYKNILRPILFLIDPEKIHDIATYAGKIAGKIGPIKYLLSVFYNYKHSALVQTVDGIKYQNPIGLAAGFDKDAHLTQVLPSMNFGFEEIGSVTALPCSGNPKPRLWRLPKQKSLVVYYGLKNGGAHEIASKLQKLKFSFPLGISIAKTNCKETADVDVAIKDYYESFIILKKYADYIAINISCPNAYGGEPFTSKERLDKLLTKLDTVDYQKPRYIKVSPELSLEQIDELIEVADKHKISGFIIGNLVKNREELNVPEKEFAKVGKGGISGKLTVKASNEMISHVYKKTQGKYTIIGCGGVFTAEDAYEKIKAGASLIQLITGMIYEGPSMMKRTNKGLVKLLRRDGYKNISEAVGVGNREKNL
ncbi:dihydroorotate dehydrogenase (quinone) [archaeon]|nr:dihydroorotate dehydrogenase (quinone) [archaeon]